MSNQTTSKAMDDVKSAAKDVAKDAKEAGGELKGDFKRLKEEILEAIKGNSGGSLGMISESLHNVRDKSTEAVESLQDSIKRNPISSVLIAAGIGMLIGVLKR